jgi:putative membrane protein insertion efficiency factor
MMRQLLILLIVFYRECISPFNPPACRFIPTCSEYAILALKKYGAGKGSFIALKRILRCHPFNPGGYDPI